MLLKQVTYEIMLFEFLLLDHGSHGTVHDQDALIQDVLQINFGRFVFGKVFH